MKTQIDTSNAPSAVGPYSQAIKTDSTLYVSGQLPIDPATGKMCEGSIEDCTRQALKNLQAILAASGVSTQNVVKTTVFLTDIADFPRANAVYGEFFEQPYPARSAFQVAALPLNGRIEIEAIVDLG